MYICSERFLTILMGNNKIMSENNVWMVRVQKEVIMCWFVTFLNFRAKWPKFVIVIFLSCIYAKQQQNYRKLCAKDLDAKCSYFGLVSIFVRFSCLGSFTFVLSVF